MEIIRQEKDQKIDEVIKDIIEIEDDEIENKKEIPKEQIKKNIIKG